MDVTKALGQKEMDALPSNILRKLKNYIRNHNEQFIQLKKLYSDAHDNSGTYS